MSKSGSPQADCMGATLGKGAPSKGSQLGLVIFYQQWRGCGDLPAGLGTQQS